MEEKEWQAERNSEFGERHELTIDRIRRMAVEESVGVAFQPFFQSTAAFLLQLEDVRQLIESGEWEHLSLRQMQDINQTLYADILEENYGHSYADPAYAVKKLGEEYGQLLSLLYTELRGGIPFVFENRLDYLTIQNELFIEIYNSFEAEELPEYKTLKDIIYWYASDYCDVFLADRIEEQICPCYSFAADIIMGADLDDERYLYRFGEYITENELGTARHLNGLPEETLRKMADVYTERIVSDSSTPERICP